MHEISTFYLYCTRLQLTHKLIINLDGILVCVGILSGYDLIMVQVGLKFYLNFLTWHRYVEHLGIFIAGTFLLHDKLLQSTTGDCNTGDKSSFEVISLSALEDGQSLKYSTEESCCPVKRFHQ